MKRSTAATRPHRIAPGTPMNHSPAAIGTAKLRLTTSCIDRYLLTRRAASSSASVVRCRLPPSRRTRRSRSSERSSRISTTNSSTMPAVAAGAVKRSSQAAIDSSGVGGAGTTSTRVGRLDCAVPALFASSRCVAASSPSTTSTTFEA